MSDDSDFDGEWKDKFETKVCAAVYCMKMSIDGKLRKGEIEKCVFKLKNNR